MTVANTNVSSSYNANGVTREWNLGFAYNSTLSGLSIVVKHADGTSTTVTENYELDGAVLTYPTVESELDPLPVGDVITIIRVTPLTQSINLTQQGPLDAETLESGYDKATLQIQEVSSKKQDKLTAGDNIVITDDGKISASGQVSGNVNWGNILGTLSDQTDLQTALNAKQSTISDLETIRSGAADGATAVQPDAISDMATETWVGEQGFLTEHQDISGKANTSLDNVTGTSGFRKLSDVYVNGTSWYKVFDEYNPTTGEFVGKWCEQGGKTSSVTETILLLKEMADTNGTIIITPESTTAPSIQAGNPCAGFVSTSQIFVSSSQGNLLAFWTVEGYIATGE